MPSRERATVTSLQAALNIANSQLANEIERANAAHRGRTNWMTAYIRQAERANRAELRLSALLDLIGERKEKADDTAK